MYSNSLNKQDKMKIAKIVLIKFTYQIISKKFYTVISTNNF